MSIALAPIRRLPRLHTSPTRVRLLAILASVLLHLVLLLRYGGEIGVNTPATQTRGISRVTLQASVAQAPPKSQPRQQQKVATRSEQVAPPQEETAVARDEPVDKPEPEASTEQAASEARQSQAQAVNQGLAADAKQRYLATLLGHIEAHKYYPLAARRRGQEGVIRVSFILNSATELGAVHVSGGNTLLQSAAREAVYRAVPFPAAPEGLRFPLQLEFKIRFSLKD